MAGAGAEEGGMRIRWRGQGPAATSSQPDAPRHPVPSMDDAKVRRTTPRGGKPISWLWWVKTKEGMGAPSPQSGASRSLNGAGNQPGRYLGSQGWGSFSGRGLELPSAPLRRQPRAMAQARCTSVLRLRGRRAPSVLRHASPPRALASPALAPRERWPHQARQRPVPGPGAPR